MGTQIEQATKAAETTTTETTTAARATETKAKAEETAEETAETKAEETKTETAETETKAGEILGQWVREGCITAGDLLHCLRGTLAYKEDIVMAKEEGALEERNKRIEEFVSKLRGEGMPSLAGGGPGGAPGVKGEAARRGVSSPTGELFITMRQARSNDPWKE
jgi:hypothetical protein